MRDSQKRSAEQEASKATESDSREAGSGEAEQSSSGSDSREESAVSPSDGKHQKDDAGSDPKASARKRNVIIAAASGFGAVLVLVVVLFATHVICFHEWSDATCIEPQICSICQKTRGEPIGHDWMDATCTVPKTCNRCSQIEGSALGHKWFEATWEKPKTCTVCKEIEGESLESTYKQGVECFSEGNLSSAKNLLNRVADFEEAVNYLTLIDRVAAFNGAYAAPVNAWGKEDKWIVLEDGHVSEYTHYKKAGYDAGFDADYVPEEEGDVLVLINKYEYQGTSAFKNDRYTLTEENGIKTIKLDASFGDDDTFTPSDKTKKEFDSNLDKTPPKKSSLYRNDC